MNWFELSVKSRANESVPVSLPTIYLGVANWQSGDQNFLIFVYTRHWETNTKFKHD